MRHVEKYRNVQKNNVKYFQRNVYDQTTTESNMNYIA